MKFESGFAIVLVSVALVGPVMADESGEGRPAWWGPIDEPRLVFSATAIREGGTGNGVVTSAQLMGGVWELFPYDRQTHEPPIRLEAWLSYGAKGNQALARMGANYGVFTPPWGPVRLSGYVRAGLEHRQNNPQAGLGGFVGVGGDIGLWIHPEWQIGMQVNRNFGISTKTWSECGLSVRYSPRRLSKSVFP